MDDLDPKLLARFRTDDIIDHFEESESAFTETVKLELARLEKHRIRSRRVALVVIISAAMLALGFGLLHLANLALIGDTPNFANNLAQPMGFLVLLGWVLFRRVHNQI